MIKHLFATGFLLVVLSFASKAQVVSGNGFFKGTFVEAGIQPTGAFGSKVSAPSDYFSATASKYSGRVGFIADVGKDGWTTGTPGYIGDFFVPGTPYEAFSVKMNGALYENAGNAAAQITGSVTGYTNDGKDASIEWRGAINNLSIRQLTSVSKNSAYILIRVYLKNTGSTAINNIYYTRSVDPDNEVDQGGSYTTINKIEEQNPGITSTALVSGRGQGYNSYLGLGSRDCRAKVAIMSSFSSDGESIYSGTGEVALSAKNATNTADNAIAVTFKIGTLQPGDSTAVAMAYVLNAADLPPAMDETDPLFNVKADTYGSGSIINVCEGSNATLTIINGDGYSWTWSPATNLSSTSGKTVQASLTGDITYTATGTNTCGTTRSINLSLHPVIAADPGAAEAIAGPSTIYQGWNATYSVPGIPNATEYKWSIPAGASFVSGYGTNKVVVRFGTGSTSGNVSVYGINSCGQGASSTKAVALSTGSSLSITSDNTGAGSSVFTAPTIVDDKIKISGSENITNARVYIDAGFQAGDILSYTGSLPADVTVAYNSTTGSLSFSGTATPAEWQAIFRDVKFSTSSSNTADRSVKFILGDVVSLTIGGKPHFYEYIMPSAYPSWDDAYAAAAGRTLFGLAGYLATITSSTENDFIKSKLSSDGWVGGSDNYQRINEVKGTTHANQSATEGKWFWVTGPEAGTAISTGNGTPVAVAGAYMNWATGEPNNSGNENYMQLYSSQNGKWNDLAGTASASVPGYVVEYGGYPDDPTVNITYARTMKSKPASPVLSSITDDSGLSSTDKITSDKTLKISGTAIANSSVKVYRAGTGLLGTVTASASGTWSYDYTGTSLADGIYKFFATATVSAVESANSDTLIVKVDATAPAAPSKPALAGSAASTTSQNTPAFSGTAEAGANVKLYSGATQIGSVYTDASGNWSITPGSTLNEGSLNITATATDTAGNVSAASAIFVLKVDRTAPVKPNAPVMTDNDGYYTNNTKPTINGKTEAKDTVKIYNNGEYVATVISDNNGDWSYTFTDDLEEGNYTITTASTDEAGNTSSVSDGREIILDTEAPAKPSTPLIKDATGTLINFNKPVYQGTAEPYSIVHVFVDGVEAGTAKAGEEGSWSFTSPSTLADLQHTVYVKAEDKAGNLSEASDIYTFNIDTQAPAKPSTPVIESSNNEGSVKTNTPAISGTAEASSKIYIYDGPGLLTTVDADASGNWNYTFSPALTDGTHNISVKAEDSAKNMSVSSSSREIIVDTQAPVTPNTPVLTGGHDNNTNDNTPLIKGGAEANSTVTIYSNGNIVTTVTADAFGNWNYEFDPSLADGTYELKITSTDKAGNTSGFSAITTIVVDTQEPGAPFDFELADNHNGYSQTNKPTISGKAEPNSVVTIYNNGGEVTTVTADPLGNWTYTFTTSLEEGIQKITATARDAAYNTSGISDEFSFIVDTQAPATPAKPGLVTANNEGIVKINNPSVSGVTEPNAKVHIYDGGILVTTITADGDGSWNYTFNPALTDGGHQVTVIAEDAAGNTSEESSVLTIVVDTQAPLTPATPELVGGNDGATNNNKPTVKGNAEPNSTVTIYRNGVPVATAQADVNGNWSYEFNPALEDGDHEIKVTSTDAAGNTSELSAGTIVHVDTQKPAAPLKPSLKNGKGDYSNTSKPTIGGKAEPGSTITVYNHGVPVGTTTTGENGDWTFTFTHNLPDGEQDITVTATDKSGNTSNTGDRYKFIVDTSVPLEPVAPQPKDTNGHGKTKNNKPSVSGKSEPGSTVTIYNNGTPVGTTVADENGDWDYTFDPALTDGRHTIQTTITDSAGNTSSNGIPVEFEVDTQAPRIQVSAAGDNAQGPFVATFKFDEPVEGFSAEHIMLLNATGSNFTKINDMEYTMLITPLSNKDVKVQLASSAAFDFAGNGNLISNELVMSTIFSAKMSDVFPNPASSTLNIKFSGVVSEKCRVMLVKASGQVVLDQQSGFSNNMLRIDVSRIAAGVYTVVVVQNNKIYQRQILIAR